MYICLGVSVYVNMYLRVWYRDSSSKIKSYINYGWLPEFKKIFLTKSWATIPNTSKYRLMKLEFRTHAQHLIFERFRKCNLCNSYRKLFKQIDVCINYIIVLNSFRRNSSVVCSRNHSWPLSIVILVDDDAFQTIKCNCYLTGAKLRQWCITHVTKHSTL